MTELLRCHTCGSIIVEKKNICGIIQNISTSTTGIESTQDIINKNGKLCSPITVDNPPKHYERNKHGCLGLNWFYNAYVLPLEEQIKELKVLIKK